MAKKELRLAVVIYGGASLAVYMHGITKELLKVVRASKVLHEVGRDAAADMRYEDGPDGRPCDTESVYFEILKQINRTSHFRVVIDVLAGASAGAINGVMLAQALVSDARLDAQTTGWLEQADVEHLGAEQVTRWRKWYLYPWLRALTLWLPRDVGSNTETRQKLARLVRSSWFRPPFSGERLCEHFFAALKAMAASRRPGSSLLPPGQRLDVYASITDLLGYPRIMRLHEQLIAREREHAAFCQLSHLATEAGALQSDFRDDNAPALVWAARASSSYAGAFPPFRHAEMRRVLARNGLQWPGEQRFLQGSVRARDGTAASRHFDPADRYFVDGGIVNNKPFRAALEALNHRPADRQVARSLVYVEPDPHTEEMVDPGRSLGYLATIRAALSTIPRNQPILEDLNDIVLQDARVQVNRTIMDANRSQVEAMVRELESAHPASPMSAERVTDLRQAMAGRAASTMGLAYRAHLQRRLGRLVDTMITAWAELSPVPGDPALRGALEVSVAHGWRDGDEPSAELPGPRPDPVARFLRRFDVGSRIRRLQFLIRRINQRESDPGLDEAARDALDEFKQQAYQFMERCYRLRRSEQIDPALAGRLSEGARQAPLGAEQALALLDELAGFLGLEALDRELDAEFCGLHRRIAGDGLRASLLGDYLGFPIYDALLVTPGSSENGPDPLTPIRVERISPADAPALNAVFTGLRCRKFMGFLGFFNRAYREHDYLWGRLNGAERVVDLLISAAGDAAGDAPALKRRLFQAIIDRERSQLRRCDVDLAQIQLAINQLDTR
ncbi:MAG: patatin-like protein [Pseudomonadales bacterium]